MCKVITSPSHHHSLPTIVLQSRIISPDLRHLPFGN
jgi:hypothetical protein